MKKALLCSAFAAMIGISPLSWAENTPKTQETKPSTDIKGVSTKILKPKALEGLEAASARFGGKCSSSRENADCDQDGAISIEAGGNDCDDNDAGRYPGNAEVPDAANRDEDCDFTTYGFSDADGDGFGDNRFKNVSGPDTVAAGEDCDDHKRSVHPNAPEVCNGIDDNCDGLIDDGVQMTLFRDSDKDGFGDAKTRFSGCSAQLQAGVVANDSDCDDRNAGRNPISGCK